MKRSLLLKPLFFTLFLTLALNGCGEDGQSFFNKWKPQHKQKNTSGTNGALDSKDKVWVEEAETTPLTVPWKGGAIAADTFIKVAKNSDAGVVNIGTTQIIKQNQPRFFGGPNGQNNDAFEEFFGSDIFKHFFGEQGEPQQEIQRPSLGSGFIINKNGLIVTNNHVVEKASEITVTIGQDREYKAKLVGADPKTDVALIKIEPKEELQPLVLGDSDQLQVGEIVVAIGNPFGLSHTVTQGIVSAKERTIGFGPYDNFIQTDASINPGNSGGPLFNLEGKVVGINTAIVASGQGIGFAIPINLAKNIITQLQETGSVTRGWLGVYIQKVDDEHAKFLGLPNNRGALVSSVQKDSPAAKAGVKAGDVILKVDGQSIINFNDLPKKIANLQVGKKVNLTLWRNKKELDVSLTIGKLPNDEELAQKEPSPEKEESPADKPDRLGLITKTLSNSLRAQLKLDEGTQGVLVTDIDRNSKVFDQGLREGDIILKINDQAIKSNSEYQEIVSKLKKDQSVLLYTERPKFGRQFIAFTLIN
ncbi:MAG TPA: DegQ family serine endoprotease [Oligoflexia bacterium]|nr:DegQ family serine endoprotease [Oligoflexia bacterium]HMR25093.1 DegQ family serine endoprotease [Oligoflexia bacterium]